MRVHKLGAVLAALAVGSVGAQFVPTTGRRPNACELAVLDIDGSETEHVSTEPDTRPDSPQTKRAAVPANDVEQSPVMSIHDRVASVYGRHWGRS